MTPPARSSKNTSVRRSGDRDDPGSAPSRLAADDWIRAAFEIMVDEGIGGVKIHRLCDRLGVTKGSFYWHFEDIDAFHGELARRWAEDGARLPAKVDVGENPNAMLLQAMEIFADSRNRNLTRAMRDWANNDDRARAAIRKADQALFARVMQAMTALGFNEDDADVRAKILYYAGVGFAHVGTLGSRSSARQQLAATWEILTRL